jgi:transposase
MLQNKAIDCLLSEHLTFAGKVGITGTHREQRRSQMIALGYCGITQQTIAWFVDSHISTVRRWATREKNAENLYDHKRSGRPPLYNEKVR